MRGGRGRGGALAARAGRAPDRGGGEARAVAGELELAEWLLPLAPSMLDAAAESSFESIRSHTLLAMAPISAPTEAGGLVVGRQLEAAAARLEAAAGTSVVTTAAALERACVIDDDSVHARFDAEMDAMRSRADRIDALLSADAGSEASADDYIKPMHEASERRRRGTTAGRGSAAPSSARLPPPRGGGGGTSQLAAQRSGPTRPNPKRETGGGGTWLTRTAAAREIRRDRDLARLKSRVGDRDSAFPAAAIADALYVPVKPEKHYKCPTNMKATLADFSTTTLYVI